MITGLEGSGDTIAAIATAAGAAGVGIVRLSGPRAIEIAAHCLGLDASKLDAHVRVGRVRDTSGAVVDQVLAFAMRAPGSFTGEDVAELQGHGGAANLARLLGAAIERGARIAEPGEFTRRAVAHGKLDLVRAEALLSVIHAGSERGLRIAHANLAGRLGEHVAQLERRALVLLAELEGRIDFPEEDLAPADLEILASEIAALHVACEGLASSFRHARALTDGISVALVGRVNAGKSSLLNALVGVERALVAAQPGTTRDWLEVCEVWRGVAITWIDTAGTRETTDPIEQRGIALGEARVERADAVVVVNDRDEAWDDGSRYRERAVVIRSKVDLDPQGIARPTAIATSATTGQGLDELRARILEVAGVADREGSEQAFVTTARQQALASSAARAFAAAAGGLRDAPPEIVAVELRAGARALAELRGMEVGERVLDEVFARFCIGK